MKIISKLTVLLVVLAAMVACTPEISYPQQDLQGYWLEEKGVELNYFRFTSENVANEAPYQWGYEWTENTEDPSLSTEESDVLADRHGNGWFKYKIERSELTEIHMMSVSEAMIPKVFAIMRLTDTDLQYRDEASRTHSLKKIVRRQ